MGRHSPTCLALLFLLSAAWGAADDIPLVKDAKAARDKLAVLTHPKTVRVGDLGKETKGILYQAETAALPAGRYRLHVPLAVAPAGGPSTTDLFVTVYAGDAKRTVGILHFDRSDAFEDTTVDFTARGRPVNVEVAWSYEGDYVKENRARAIKTEDLEPVAPLIGGDEGGLDELDAELDLDAGGTIALATAKKTETRLLTPGAFVEPLGPVEIVSVATDKIVYRPGDTGKATVLFRNHGRDPVTFTPEIARLTGFDDSQSLAAKEMTLAPGAESAWTGTFETKGLLWGGEIAVSVAFPGRPAEAKRAVFAVHDDAFAVCIIGAYPQDKRKWETLEGARQIAREWREQGFTGFEAFFWAPCDFSDFTPETELFFGSQGAYPCTITGMRNLIAAFHEQGMCATVYANLWGGGGPPGFELMRQHPEWFGDANYVTSVFDDWDLLGMNENMGDRKVRAPGVEWTFNQLRLGPPKEVFLWHANELIGTNKQFGWDGVRYDSHYSRQWTVDALQTVRHTVAAKVPHFRFGYNSFAHRDHNALGLDDMVEGGGMIMAEGIRPERKRHLGRYLAEMQAWRDLVWPYGGHFGPLHTTRADDVGNLTPLDEIYACCAMLAAGGHPYYNSMSPPLGAFPAMALRYSDIVFNTDLRPLADVKNTVRVEKGDFLQWEPLARTVSLDGKRHRLILHLLNMPADRKAFTDQVQTYRPAVEDVPVLVRLPQGGQPLDAWAVTATPKPEHERIDVQAKGDTVRLVVPSVRFYTLVVLDYEAASPIPPAVTERDKVFTYIQDWQVVGPFENDREMSKWQVAYLPETLMDSKQLAEKAKAEGFRVAPSRSGDEPVFDAKPVDIRKVLGLGGESGVAYLFTTVVSDADRDVLICAKFDQTFALWCNGEKLIEKPGGKELNSQEETQVKVRLRKGENQIMVKCADKWGDWLLALRVAAPNGDPLRAGIAVAGQTPFPETNE